MSASQLFQNKVDLYFMSSISTCGTCDDILKIYKTMIRKKSTLAIGDFTAKVTQVYCGTCHKIYGDEEIRSIIPKGSHFGFDIIEFIGKSLFKDHMSDERIQELLREKNIMISLREISYLGKKFIIYLALAHQSCQNKINSLMKSNGGYILHLDGTCAKDSPHLFSFIDGISKIVLDNIKIASESTKLIKPNLEEIKNNYGNPIAIVHDMSSAIINAVESVFPDAKDFICHLHFLRDIGKDLFNIEYSSIKRCLKSFKIRTILRAFARELKNYIVQMMI
jgi:hypothetical protein